MRAMSKLGNNQLSGLSPRERREKKAEMVLEGRVRWWRKLMAEGKEVRAMEYARTYKFDDLIQDELEAAQKMATVIAANPEPAEPVVDVLTGDFGKVNIRGFVHNPNLTSLGVIVEDKPEVMGQDLAGQIDVSMAEPVVATIEMINGWPVRCEAEVYRRPLNKKLMVIRLDDGREARLWNASGRSWTLGARVKVKLSEAGTDAIYEGDFGE